MERRVQRALADLQRVRRDLLQPLGDGPAMSGSARAPSGSAGRACPVAVRSQSVPVSLMDQVPPTISLASPVSLSSGQHRSPRRLLRWRVSLVLTALLFLLYYGYIVLIAVEPRAVVGEDRRGHDARHSPRRGGHRRRLGADRRLRGVGQPALRSRSRPAAPAAARRTEPRSCRPRSARRRPRPSSSSSSSSR